MSFFLKNDLSFPKKSQIVDFFQEVVNYSIVFKFQFLVFEFSGICNIWG